jgi:predicted nucleic acid-binding protein
VSEKISDCVVDASVGIKLFVEEPLSEQAHSLFDRLASDPHADLHIPDLFYIECTNILWKYTRRFDRPLEDSLSDLIDLGHLALHVTSTADLMEEALSLAAQTGLTAYDACYAVLARRLNLPLVTADKKLSQVISWAVWLGDLDIQEE